VALANADVQKDYEASIAKQPSGAKDDFME
jgi:hypothetical protein